jgi:hypothetical protein
MSRYRVKVESYVVVEASNVGQAKARAELALRKAIREAYLESGDFADGWELYGWQAKKAERLGEDD